MIDGNICAFCRHWKFSTTDLKARADALQNGIFCECHIHQPAQRQGKDTCRYFEEVFHK